MTVSRPTHSSRTCRSTCPTSHVARLALREACEAAGVKRYTAHGLRRLVAVELLDQADPKTVSELTGHSVTVLLRDYVRPRPERLRDVVQRAHGRKGKIVKLRALGTGPRREEPDDDDV